MLRKNSVLKGGGKFPKSTVNNTGTNDPGNSEDKNSLDTHDSTAVQPPSSEVPNEEKQPRFTLFDKLGLTEPDIQFRPSTRTPKVPFFAKKYQNKRPQRGFSSIKPFKKELSPGGKEISIVSASAFAKIIAEGLTVLSLVPAPHPGKDFKVQEIKPDTKKPKERLGKKRKFVLRSRKNEGSTPEPSPNSAASTPRSSEDLPSSSHHAFASVTDPTNSPPPLTEQEVLDKHVPKEFHEYAEVFSSGEAKKMPPH
ncbi:hypothetical protein PQX77_003129, partial [Marasmius sp. AFHP31]